MMRFKCQFLGCSGIIDVNEQIDELENDVDCEEIPWLLHTLSCPKCHNNVGSLEIDPDRWLVLPSKGRKYYTIHNPRKDRTIKVKKKESLSPYLKKWARRD